METLKLIGDILKSEITRNLIMIIAAAAAYLIYYLNKRDSFRNASKVILLEIKEVEKVISDYRIDGKINFNLPILKSNSWKEYKHYFVKKLDQDEFEQINDFYTLSEIIEKERIIISNSLTIAMEEKGKLLQKLIVELAKENFNDIESYKKKRNECCRILHEEEYFFEPSNPKRKFSQAINGINCILNTNTGLKLKKFSKYR